MMVRGSGLNCAGDFMLFTKALETQRPVLYVPRCKTSIGLFFGLLIVGITLTCSVYTISNFWK